MATVNFSVPDEVKQAFNDEFAQENKSAILTRLMKQAIDENRVKKRRHDAIDAILALREHQSPVLIDEVSSARNIISSGNESCYRCERYNKVVCS